MVELVDTLVSGTSDRKVVGVRVPLWVHISTVNYQIRILTVSTSADGGIGRHATLRG